MALSPLITARLFFRMFPQLVLARMLLGDSVSYVVVPAAAHWVMSALELLGFSGCPVYEVGDVVGVEHEELHAVVGHHLEGFCHPGVMRAVEDFLAEQFPCSGRLKAEKLYVSRAFVRSRRPNYRPLVNEGQVEGYFRGRGFDIVHSEKMPLSGQINLFTSARYVAGPSGSGMLNASFSRNAFIIDMESFAHTVRQHAHVYASSNCRFGFVFGQIIDADRPIVSPWKLDLNLVERALKLAEC